MSRSGFIDFNLNTNGIVAIENILDSFAKCGWHVNIDGKIRYTPLNDNEDFNWLQTNISNYSVVLQILKEKQTKQELIAISFLFDPTVHGIDALIYPDLNKITFGLHINRRTIDTTGITDFTWYIVRIIPVLELIEMEIGSIECLDA